MAEQAEQRKALITFENPRGFVFAEDVADHVSVYIHQRSVIGARYLHTGDMVSYDLLENPKQPGRFQGINVRYAGHNVARQVADRTGGPR